MCNFTIGYTDMFGSSLTKELKENGAEIAVTNENRQVSDLGVGGRGGGLKGSVIFYGGYIERLLFLPKVIYKKGGCRLDGSQFRDLLPPPPPTRG